MTAPDLSPAPEGPPLKVPQANVPLVARAFRSLLSGDPNGTPPWVARIATGDADCLVDASINGLAVHADAAGETAWLAMRDARLAVAPNDPTRQRDVAVALANHADLLRAAGHAPDACAAARRGQALLRGMQRRGELAARDARVEIPRLDVAADAACD